MVTSAGPGCPCCRWPQWEVAHSAWQIWTWSGSRRSEAGGNSQNEAVTDVNIYLGGEVARHWLVLDEEVVLLTLVLRPGGAGGQQGGHLVPVHQGPLHGLESVDNLNNNPMHQTSCYKQLLT